MIFSSFFGNRAFDRAWLGWAPTRIFHDPDPPWTLEKGITTLVETVAAADQPRVLNVWTDSVSETAATSTTQVLPGEPVRIYNETGTGPIVNGNAGATQRMVHTVTGDAAGQIRITIGTQDTVGNIVATHLSVGTWTGSAADTTTTPVELKFGGASGLSFAASAGATRTSDWADLAGFTTANKLVTIIDWASTCNGQLDWWSPSSGVTHEYWKASSASWDQATSPSGMTDDGACNMGVVSIEVRVKPSSGISAQRDETVGAVDYPRTVSVWTDSVSETIAIGPGAPTTIFSASPAGGSGDDSNDPPWTYRNILPITGNAQGQVRATFQSASGGPLTAAHCSIGVWAGSGQAATTATPVELTFSGASGFAIATNSQITSDWVNLAGFTSSNKLVVIFDVGSSNNLNRQWVTASYEYWSGGSNSYNVASPSGLTDTTGVDEGIVSVEVRTGAAGGDTTDATKGAGRVFNVEVGESAAAADVVTAAEITARTAAETIAAADSPSATQVTARSVGETIAAGDAPNATLTSALSTAETTSATETANVGVSAGTADSAATTDTPVATLITAVARAETVAATEAPAATETSAVAIAESAGATDAANVGVTASAVEAATATDTTTAIAVRRERCPLREL
jgi:hypothetical protein